VKYISVIALSQLRLGDCEANLNGNEEGTLFLRRLPTPEEAAVIRDRLGMSLAGPDQP
jgi:hypothetical protein